MENGTGLDTHWKEVMTALPNRHYSGHHRAIEIEDDQRTCGKEIWRKKWGQQVSGTAGVIIIIIILSIHMSNTHVYNMREYKINLSRVHINIKNHEKHYKCTDET